jgi:NADH dehydrogenase
MIAAAAGTTKTALPAPAPLLKVLAAALDQYAFFPITRDQLTMLMEGNTCGGQDAFQTFGLEPAHFNTTELAYLQGNN